MVATFNLESLLGFDQVKSKKVFSQENFSLTLITLEKGNKLKAHSSPKDAVLVVLQGHIHFHLEGGSHPLKAQDLIAFEKDQIHEVDAIEDSRFILIR